MTTRSLINRMIMVLALPAMLFSTGCGEANVGDAQAAALADNPENRSPRRRVWAQAGDYSNVSPDGRLVTWVDWDTGDVAVYDLSTEEARRVTDKGTWSENGSWSEEPIFAADGSQIAFTYGNVFATEGEPFLYELRVVGVDGAGEKVLFQFEPGDRGWVAPEAWSEEYGIVAQFWFGPADGRVGIVDPESGDVDFVASIGRAGMGNTVLSPDGRWAAFLHDQELTLLDLQSPAMEKTGVRGEALYGWTVDGEGLLIRGGGSGAGQVSLLPVRDGQVAGAAEPVEDGLIYTSGAGQSGDRYFYLLPVDGPRVYNTAVDMEANRLLAEPTPVSPVTNGQVMDAAWSPDGRQQAWVHLGPDGGSASVMIRSADGEDLVALAELGRTQRAEALTWSPDGSAVYLNHIGAGSEGYRVLRIDARTGQVTTLFSDPSRYGGAEILALVVPGEDGLVISRMADGGEERPRGEVVYHDLVTGEEEVLLGLAEITRTFSISPDGKQIALVGYLEENGLDAPPSLVIQPMDGGAAKVLFNGPSESTNVSRSAGRLPWSADGTHVLVVQRDRDSDPASAADPWLTAISVDEGTWTRLPISLNIPSPAGNSNVRPDWHPDGRRISLIMGTGRSELWMMEGIN